MTLQDAQQEAYHAYDPASGIPEDQFIMEFIKSKYPQLIKPKVVTQAPTDMAQEALAPEVVAPVVPVETPNRLQGILKEGYLNQEPQVSVKDRLKGILLPDGWDVKGGNITTPSGFSFGKKGLGYMKKF